MNFVSKSTIKNLLSLFTVGIAALVLATPTDAHALTPSQTRAKIADLHKQLVALPKYKAPFAKINNLTTQLVTLIPKNASFYLAIALPKIGLPNSSQSASALTSRVNSIVTKASGKIVSASQKKALIAKNNALLKKYKPPTPWGPGPYQSRRTMGSEWIA